MRDANLSKMVMLGDVRRERRMPSEAFAEETPINQASDDTVWLRW